MAKRLKPRKPIDPLSTPRERSLDALALTRRGYSLRRASELSRTDPRTVLRHVGTAFRREGRRYRPTPFDRIPREMTVLTPLGPETVTVRDSRAASKLSRQPNAIHGYLRYGDTEGLAGLRGQSITVNGRRYELYLEPDVVDRLAAGGELHYELYRR